MLKVEFFSHAASIFWDAFSFVCGEGDANARSILNIMAKIQRLIRCVDLNIHHDLQIIVLQTC